MAAVVSHQSLSLRQKFVRQSHLTLLCDLPNFLNIFYLLSDIRDPKVEKKLIEFTDHEKIDAVLLPADLEKAFDSVNHVFFFSTLKCFGFSDGFVRRVPNLVNDAESCVMSDVTVTQQAIFS